MEPNKLEEMAFDWTKGIEGLPKERLLKVVAKTTAPTIHPEDPYYPIRLFGEEELKQNSRSIIGRPVGVNHEKMPIYGAYGVDSQWNDEEKQLECLLLVPSEYIKKVKEGKIKNASIEYTWRNTKKTEQGTDFEGLAVTRVDLVEGLEPGDPNAIVELFEASEQKGVVLAEVIPPKELGEPCSPELRACVDALLAKGTPEDSAWAICKSQLGETAKEKRLKELEEAVTRLSTQISTLETSRNQAIEDAKREAKCETIGKIDAVIPKNIILRQGSAALVRLTQDIRKVLRDESGTTN